MASRPQDLRNRRTPTPPPLPREAVEEAQRVLRDLERSRANVPEVLRVYERLERR